MIAIFSRETREGLEEAEEMKDHEESESFIVEKISLFLSQEESEDFMLSLSAGNGELN